MEIHPPKNQAHIRVDLLGRFATYLFSFVFIYFLMSINLCTYSFSYFEIYRFQKKKFSWFKSLGQMLFSSFSDRSLYWSYYRKASRWETRNELQLHTSLPPLSRPPGCLARSSQKKETATKLPGKQLSDPESLSCLLWDGIKTVFTWPNVLPKWFFKGIHNWLWRTPFHRSIRPVCSACLLCAASWIKFF